MNGPTYKILPASGLSILLCLVFTNMSHAQDVPIRKPVKVYILAGQSNMLEMGDISGRNSRHTGFFQNADPESEKGVEVSIYSGKYDASADYDQLKPIASETVVYDGMAKNPFPKVDGSEGEVTYVARGFIEVKTTGMYELSPGYGGSTYNVTELDGKEVYRRETDKDPIKAQAKMVGGKRYAFKTTFFTTDANNLFWVGRTDIPGTLNTLVRQKGQFSYLLDENKKWAVRDDVHFQDARLHGGWDWDSNDTDKMVLDRSKLLGACKPLTVGKGVWVGVPFGFMLGDHHDAPVLIIRSAIGNRGLAWDFRPPSSGKLPNIADDLKKWEGVEYYMMINGVRESLQNIDQLIPDYQDRGFELAGMVWFQGHKDTGNEEWASSYEQHLVNLITDVRKDLEVPELPVVVATVGFEGHEMSEETQVVWESQMALGNPEKYPEYSDTVKVVDTRDFWQPQENSPSGQGYHYNRNAGTYMHIGEAMAKKMIELVSEK